MKLLRLILALFLYASPAFAVTHIVGDPTGGANGSAYNDMNEFDGGSPDSTILDGPISFSNRQYLRFKNCTFGFAPTIDSLSRAVIIDGCVLEQGFALRGDSCKIANSTIRGRKIAMNMEQFSSSVDTLASRRPDFWIQNDTLSNCNITIVDPYYGSEAVVLRGVKNLFWDAVRCSIWIHPNGQSPAFKMFESPFNTFHNSSWRIYVGKGCLSQESGTWLLRDVSWWNKFVKDTVWMTGPQQGQINFCHSGDNAFQDQILGTLVDSCLFVNFSADQGAPMIYYQSHINQFTLTNSVIACRSSALRLFTGTRNNVSSVPSKISHNTFVSMNNGQALEFSEGSCDQAFTSFMANGIFTHNIFYNRGPGMTGRYNCATYIAGCDPAELDTLNWNLYYTTASLTPIMNGSTLMTVADFTTATGLDAASRFGSPAFKDSTMTFRFDPTPRDSVSYAFGNFWPHGYVGAIAPVVVDSLPRAIDTVYVATVSNDVWVNFSIPRDDHGVTSYEIYRSTTNDGATPKFENLYIRSKRANDYYQGQSIDVHLGKHKTGVTWYYWFLVRDTKGQYSTAYKRTISTSSGGGSWSWPP